MTENEHMMNTEAHNRAMAVTEKGQLKYQKLSFVMNTITMLMVAAIMLVVVAAVITIKPMITDIYDSTMISLENLEALTEELKNADLDGTVKNINDLTMQATGDLTDAMGRLNEIDLETLNEAINNLNQTVKPFAEFFGR